MYDNVTAIVKTFERPACLQRLLKSIARHYPGLTVLVADDSLNPLSAIDGAKTVIQLPYDVGIARGRNTLLNAVDTPYFLLLDDDFIFSERTNLQLMYDVLSNTTFNLVGGRIGRFIGGIFSKRGRSLHICNRHNLGYESGYPIYECVLNFFMAETAAVREVHWDDNLKRREHVDFFLRGRQTLRITAVDSYVHHVRTTGNRTADIEYGRIKRNRYESQKVLRKWGIDAVRWR